jgi:hypothetical protein
VTTQASPGPFAFPGTCRCCKSRRNVFDCSRKAGGNHRRPQQTYSSSICAACAVSLLSTADPDHGASGWSVASLRSICTALLEQTNPDDPRADLVRNALTSYAEKVAAKERRRAAGEERMRPYRDRIAERAEARDWIMAQQHVDGMDERTCRNLSYGVKNGKAGHERTGYAIEADGTWTWARTMRQQVVDFINDPANDEYDAATRQALVEGIRDGLHRPAHLRPDNQET